MAEVLCVYREVEVLKQSSAAQEQETPSVAIISYDEKPGVQAIGTTAPDLPPEPLRHNCMARDHEYVRHGTLSLLAGIDLVTGAVHASVEERHRSREFVELSTKARRRLSAVNGDQADPRQSFGAHLQGNQGLARRAARGAFHPSCSRPSMADRLNLVEGFFSKLARSALRHIRVASKQELKDRIITAIDDINRDPVVHTWTYKINEAA